MRKQTVDRSQNDILLLVQEDKRFGEEKISDAEAQLIAEAIAAFSLNNSLRRDVGVPELDSKVLSGRIFHSKALIAQLDYARDRHVGHHADIL